VKVVSWQSVLTEHQVHTTRALQDVSHESMVIVSGVKELKERKGQGWTMPDVSDLDVRYLEKSGWWKAGIDILCANKEAIHLFNGLWADRRFFALLLEAQRRGIQTALITEPFAEVPVGYLGEGAVWKERLKTKLRPWLYRIGGWFVAKKLKAVFAISNKAVEQFSKIGVRSDVIFPFGYFIPAMQMNGLSCSSVEGGIKLIFVGALIQRKGIQTLVNAMRICNAKKLNVQLDIYGHGDVEQLRGVNGVAYKGTIPFGQAQKVIAEYDVLVLPSLHDGWGVVVNEALLQDVPVIVSDQVGAKTLIEKSGAGLVLPAGDCDAWVNGLSRIAQDSGCVRAWKAKAATFKQCLLPEVAAQYMYECLREDLHKPDKKIDNPWYSVC